MVRPISHAAAAIRRADVRDVIEQVNNLYGINFGKRWKIVNNQSLALELFHSQTEVYSSYWRAELHLRFDQHQRAAPH